MNEMNDIINQFQKYKKKKKIFNNDIFKEKIEILKEINNIFINEFIKKISNFINIEIKFISFCLIEESDLDEINIKKVLTYFNTIEILPIKSQLYAIFPTNILFFIIDILFGGNIQNLHNDNKNFEKNSTELLINHKIICFLIESYSYAWKKFFSIEMNCISVKKNTDFKKDYLNDKNIPVIYKFFFKINDIIFYFYLISPMTILNKLHKKKNLSPNNYTNVSKKISYPLSIEMIKNVKLKIIAQLEDFSISEQKICNLSVGDILEINNPKKVIAYIENIPVLSGDYKLFYEKSCIIIKDFINVN
ncbi:FliM/FliN family flagellar motor switch protein [Buchnera aphidicola]|uniref:FliM/FliN family flagellar motor switch protein n=1 Tax=Buchnera aphidicola TaxID=9 RepID=UPI003BEED52A